MREFPRGGMIGKAVHLSREIGALRIPVLAANACYFIVLSVFPSLLLLLGLLRYTPLEVERLGEVLEVMLPGFLLEGAEELILMTYDNTSGAALGISAVTALWSASRGIYGLLTGLNAIYHTQESRGYIRTRLLCVFYTFVFLLVLLLTLGLHVFGGLLFELLGKDSKSLFGFLMQAVNVRFLLLLSVQIGVFVAMFCFLPSRRSGVVESLPGAMVAALGWQVFSNLYSAYVEHSTGLASVYGSVYAVALSMVWLYFCVSILFYGGVLNRLLAGKWEE